MDVSGVSVDMFLLYEFLFVIARHTFTKHQFISLTLNLSIQSDIHTGITEKHPHALKHIFCFVPYYPFFSNMLFSFGPHYLLLSGEMWVLSGMRFHEDQNASTSVYPRRCPSSRHYELCFGLSLEFHREIENTCGCICKRRAHFYIPKPSTETQYNSVLINLLKKVVLRS
jgi:hypothetical protein